MDGLSLQGMTNRMSHAIRDKAEKRAQEQRRSLMYLVAEFFKQQGLYKSLEFLIEEAQLSDNYKVCDNVDLEIIFQEYNDYYHTRFHKYPKICKQVEPQVLKDVTKSSVNKDNKTKQKQRSNDDDAPEKHGQDHDDGFVLTVKSLADKAPTAKRLDDRSNKSNELFRTERVLKPLGNLYPAGSEWMEIAEIITREIVVTDLNVHWDDIYGLENCKDRLKEAAVYPTKYPWMFTRNFPPWRGILLYGSPGTGKTMLAKAVATECDLTFFNITASSLVSKWRGDSEKYVRVLFELADYHQPSVIFIDEIDWIASRNGSDASDKSEPARRFRAELLSRLDGLLSKVDSRVILLAATNAPECLDSALLRRLETHVPVDKPDLNIRRKILECYTDQALHNTKSFECILNKTDGYSGADLKCLCKDAWMYQMRPIWKKMDTMTGAERKIMYEDSCKSPSRLIEDCKYYDMALSSPYLYGISASI